MSIWLKFKSVVKDNAYITDIVAAGVMLCPPNKTGNSEVSIITGNTSVYVNNSQPNPLHYNEISFVPGHSCVLQK